MLKKNANYFQDMWGSENKYIPSITLLKILSQGEDRDLGLGELERNWLTSFDCSAQRLPTVPQVKRRGRRLMCDCICDQYGISQLFQPLQQWLIRSRWHILKSLSRSINSYLPLKSCKNYHRWWRDGAAALQEACGGGFISSGDHLHLNFSPGF